MTKNFQSVVLGWAGLALLGLSVAANGVPITEYFNGYGTLQTRFDNLPPPNGGTGWAGDYSGYSGGNPLDRPYYLPGTNLNPTVTGYSSPQNLAGSNDGAAGLANQITWARRPTGPLTGTIWISAAFRVGTGNRGLAMSFDSNAQAGTVPNYVWLCSSVWDGAAWPTGGPAQQFSYDGGVTYIPATTFNFAGNSEHLLVARIIINDNGTNDRLTVWTHPGDVSSFAALGAPNFDQATADAFGTSLDYFWFYCETTGVPYPAIDSIRISDDANLAFGFVTTGMVPEPATLTLLTLAGLALLRRRK